jgi:hypothetical protein
VTIFTLMRTANNAPQAPSLAGISVPGTSPDTAVPRPASPPQGETEVKNKLPAGGGDQRIIMADSKTYAPTIKRPMQPPLKPTASDDNGDFYPISYGGNDTLAGGRIVRVDLPKAQAFAMGIHVPLENDSDTVKADVIVGPDGVPRAVRLVK